MVLLLISNLCILVLPLSLYLLVHFFTILVLYGLLTVIFFSLSVTPLNWFTLFLLVYYLFVLCLVVTLNRPKVAVLPVVGLFHYVLVVLMVVTVVLVLLLAGTLPPLVL